MQRRLMVRRAIRFSHPIHVHRSLAAFDFFNRGGRQPRICLVRQCPTLASSPRAIPALGEPNKGGAHASKDRGWNGHRTSGGLRQHAAE